MIFLLEINEMQIVNYVLFYIIFILKVLSLIGIKIP